MQIVIFKTFKTFENKVLIMFFVYVPEGKQVGNKESFLFIEIFQLVNNEGKVELECHHFATRKEIMD